MVKSGIDLTKYYTKDNVRLTEERIEQLVTEYVKEHYEPSNLTLESANERGVRNGKTKNKTKKIN